MRKKKVKPTPFEKYEQKVNKHLDRLAKKFSKKYPNAKETEVLTFAELRLRHEKITDKTWEGLWKLSHNLNSLISYLS